MRSPPLSKSINRRKTVLLLFSLGIACVRAAAQEKASPGTVNSPTISADTSQEPVIYEKVRGVIRYGDDGRGTKEASARIRVQTYTGIQKAGQLVFQYKGANERVEVKSLKVIKPDGTVITAGRDAVVDVSSPVVQEAPMYSDARQKHVSVPGLSVGDIIEYDVVTRVFEPFTPGQFWDTWDFVTHSVCLDEEIVLDVPANRILKIKSAEGMVPTVDDQAGRRKYTWKTENKRAIEEVNASKSFRTFNPSEMLKGLTVPTPRRMLFSTFQNWNEIGQWYDTLAQERQMPSPAVRAKADEITRGATSELAKVQAIYEYVSHIRYVSLSFGVGRYQPHSAAEVLTNLYGDCKDKATLLDALLAAEGIHSATALINSQGAVDRGVPTPLQFDHAINMVSLGGKEIWLDATTGVSPFGYLLPQLRDKDALVVLYPQESELRRSPAEESSAKTYRYEIEKTIDEKGAEQAKLLLEIQGGDWEVLLRLLLSRISTAQFGQMLNGDPNLAEGGYRGIYSEVKASDPYDLKKPLRLEANYNRSLDSSVLPGKPNSPLPMVQDILERSLPIVGADTDNKQRPIPLGGPKELFLHIKVSHRGPTNTSPLKPVHITKDFAEYSLESSSEEETLTVDAHLNLHAKEVDGGRGGDYMLFRTGVLGSLTLSAAPADAAKTKTSPPTPASSNSTNDSSKQLESPAQALFVAARRAASNRDYSTCAQLLEEAVAKDPNHKFAWGYLGWTYNTLGKYEKAEVALRKAVALNASDSISYNNLGQALAGQKKYEEAIPQYLKQIELNPRDQWAHGNLGRIYLQLQQYLKAIPELETAASITPDDPYVPFNLGRAYAKIGQPEKAAKSLMRSVELQPVSFRWNAVAYEMALDNLNLDQAQKYVESAIAATVLEMQSPSLDHITNEDVRRTAALAAYWDTFGWIRFQQGKLAEAEKYVKSAWMLHSTGEVGDHLAQIYEKEGRKPEAIHQYELALATTQPMPETRGRLASLLGGDHDVDNPTEQAKTQLKEARTIRIKNSHQGEGLAEFWILMSPGPKVRGVKFITGDDELAQFSKDLEAGSFPDCFPEATEVELLRRGRLSCPPSSSNCSLLLMSAETVQPAELSGFGAPPEIPTGRVRLDGNVMRQKIKFKVAPTYPSEARANGVQGMVRLHAIIATDGSTKQLQVISGNALLVQAALDAVRQWKYEPTLLNGQPVEVDTEIAVLVHLDKGD
jgi:TonB family protein